MTDQQPMSPEPCEHHWIHYGQPSHSPIRWIVKCSQCNQFSIADLQEQVDAIEAAAEQRGAEAALLCVDEPSWEHHDQTDGFPCTNCLNKAQKGIDRYRADQEGDDE